MTRKHVATVLDTKLALHLTLYKVAPGAEDSNDETEAHPLQERERGFVTRNDCTHSNGKNGTTYATNP